MLRFALILAFALLAAPASAQLPDAWWQRGWVVEEIRCPRCDAAAMREMRGAIGQTITLLPDRFDNPLYQGCDGRPNYDSVARRPRAEAEQAFQRPWSLPRLASPMPVAGMVRCPLAQGGLNNVGYFVFDNAQRGYYRWEGGAVAVLR